MGAERFGTSTQVLQEFYVNATRKMAAPLKPHEAFHWIDLLEAQALAIVDSSIVKRAIELSLRFQISYWDGAIIAAAEALGAATLYTEDLNDGQLYGDVRAVNPFAAA
jgi:predicted nucleic acid-binding protein